jgi:hypothetical protein
MQPEGRPYGGLCENTTRLAQPAMPCQEVTAGCRQNRSFQSAPLIYNQGPSGRCDPTIVHPKSSGWTLERAWRVTTTIKLSLKSRFAVIRLKRYEDGGHSEQNFKVPNPFYFIK